jgi:WD40 repeat protein/serine/threonine protein kinase
MKEPNICPTCGAKVSPRALEGFCPACTAKLTFDLPAEPSPRDAAVTALEFGDYELFEEIGRGGMGVVYRARQRSLDRVVALKMILSGRFAGKGSVERLRAEATAAAALQHPNIVAIHEIGEIEGQHFFTMDYVEGRSLAEVISDLRFTIYDFRRSARWLKTLAEAIHYAHEHGVLHRDLKPSNVLVDAHDQPRVTDFGLAKQFVVPASAGAGDAGPAKAGTTSELSLTGHPIGSPSFMPPEQAAGRRNAIGPHSDVYGLGALLYHLLTGRAPFAAATLEATLAQVLQNDPVPPRALNASVPRDLETICLKCLEKEPARRYQTARELAEELARFEKDEPIFARPATPAEKLWRWARRNPRVASLTASLIAVFLAGLAGVLWQWRRAERHAQTETRQRQHLEQVLAHREIQEAEELFGAADAPSALARLARVLRQNPTNHVTATRLLSALTFRGFALPMTAPLMHEATVMCAQFSPDGQRVVTGAADGAVRVWDAQSGRRLLDLPPHGRRVRHAVFSPDGERIATASEDRTARVWDARTGKPVTPPLRHWAKIRRIHFSPDGKRVATASGDSMAQLWDSQTGRAAAPTLQHGDYVNEAIFSPDGKRVATVSEDTTACVWDAVTGRRLAGPMPHEQSRDVLAVRFSPDGKRIVTASTDGARVWDADTGALIVRLAHQGTVPFAEFSPDGTKVVTGSHDKTARVWDATSGEPLTPPLVADANVLRAEFSPDGRKVFTISDASARLWDAESGRALTEPFRHEASLEHVGGFDPDGGRVVTPSLDGSAIIWDARNGAASPEKFELRGTPFWVACNPDGRRIAVALTPAQSVDVLDLSTGQVVAGPLEVGSQLVNMEFSPDGRYLLTACYRSGARIWDVRSGQLVIPPISHGQPMHVARFSRDGRRVVTAADDDTARVWEAATGRELTPPLRHTEDVQWAEFSADDRRVVTASSDNTARVWDSATGEPLTPPLPHELDLRLARFSPDGNSVLTVSEDGAARLWNLKTGELIGRPLLHRGNVRSAKFSPDGQRVITVSVDNTARLWDARTSEPLTEPLKHGALLVSGYFTPDGRSVLTLSHEPVTRLWDTASGHLLCEPLPHSGTLQAAAFLSDGTRLLTACADQSLNLWDLPALPLPVPDWLPELTEAVAGKRFDAQGRSIPVPARRLMQLRQELGAGSGPDFYARWARWFFADRKTRANSPFAP